MYSEPFNAMLAPNALFGRIHIDVTLIYSFLVLYRCHLKQPLIHDQLSRRHVIKSVVGEGENDLQMRELTKRVDLYLITYRILWGPGDVSVNKYGCVNTNTNKFNKSYIYYIL